MNDDFILCLSRNLYEMGFILVEDEYGCFHLRNISESEKIGVFMNLTGVACWVEADLDNKSDDICELLNLFWKDYFGKLSAITSGKAHSGQG